MSNNLFAKNNVAWGDHFRWFDVENVLTAAKIIKVFAPIHHFIDCRMDEGIFELRVHVKSSKGNAIPSNSIEITDKRWDIYPIMILQFELGGSYFTFNMVSTAGIAVEKRTYHLTIHKEEESLKTHLLDWGIIIREI